MIKAMLLHLSNNMWMEEPAPERLDMEYFRREFPSHCNRMPQYWDDCTYSDKLKCEDAVWARVTEHFAKCGGNMVVIDVGDGIQFESHPEIAVEGAWSIEKFRNELARLRGMGLEPIPKLNFSTCHDAWMHEYSRMVSSQRYYNFCHDIIREVSQLFDRPRFFHIGMDEETGGNQSGEGFPLKIVRADRLWWHDLRYLCDEVRLAGARPWMWSDKLWNTDPEVFATEVPHDVLQSNWYYRDVFDFADARQEDVSKMKTWLGAFELLEQLGYEQLPGGSTWGFDENYPGLVDFCSRTIPQEHLLGFMMAPWYMMRSVTEPWLNEACEIFKSAHA